MKKKGQATGSRAATLILVILLLIIFYILFLPQSERDNLLGESSSSHIDDDSNDNHNVDNGDYLLQRRDITLSGFVGEEERMLPDVMLFERINAKELATMNPFTIRNGWFDRVAKNFTFVVDDPEIAENILLSFRIKDVKGILTIKLNGITLYEYEANTGDIEPIEINRAYLQKMNNIEFSVSGVGSRFWTTNRYSIESAKITADITDLKQQEAENTFSFNEEELANIETVKLVFTPVCSEDVGPLDIRLNGRQIYSSIPNCNDFYQQPIPIGLLDAGDNYISFETSEGTYNIRNIKLSVDFKTSMRKKTYYFDLSNSEYDDVDGGDRDVRLRIKFKGDEPKIGEYEINDHTEDFDLDGDDHFISDIVSRYIEEEDNEFTIRPEGNLDIEYIIIELED